MAAPSHWSILAQISAPSPLEAVKHAPLTVIIAAALLLLFFLVCFIVLAGRLRLLTALDRADRHFVNVFRASAHPLAILHNDEKLPPSPCCRLYAAGAGELAYQLLGLNHAGRDFLLHLRAAGKISPSQMKAVRAALQRDLHLTGREFAVSMGPLVGALRFLPWLAVLSPLLAWLETGGPATEAARQTLYMQSLAPVAIALLGTVFCQLLLHWVDQRASRLGHEAEAFSLELAHAFDRSYVDYHHPIDQLPSISSFGPPEGPNFSLPPGDLPPAPRAIVAEPPPP